MIYLISGVSRSGKSKLANELHQKTGISYLPLDAIMMAFMHRVKEVGIHDKLWPDVIAEKLWPFLKSFIETLLHNEIDYIIEGEAMLPNLLSPLLKKYPNIMTVFLGYDGVDIEQKVSDCKTHHTGNNDWLVVESDEFIVDHVENMERYSRKIRDLCEKFDVVYINTTYNFLDKLEDAKALLLKENNYD